MAFNDFCTALELLKWPIVVDIIHITSMVQRAVTLALFQLNGNDPDERDRLMSFAIEGACSVMPYYNGKINVTGSSCLINGVKLYRIIQVEISECGRWPC